MDLRTKSAVAAIAALTLFAGTASAADFPKGTISAEREGARWSIRFDDGGEFTVSRDDEVMVEGKYKATRDEIELTDEKGPIAEPGAKAGKYRWKRDGKKMTFTKVEDESQGRAGALTTLSWTLKD
jgi:hypothetical protein